MKLNDDSAARLLNMGAVAHRIDRSKERVRQLLKSGKLRGYKTPIGYLFEESEIARYERERGKTSGEASGRQ